MIRNTLAIIVVAVCSSCAVRNSALEDPGGRESRDPFATADADSGTSFVDSHADSGTRRVDSGAAREDAGGEPNTSGQNNDGAGVSPPDSGSGKEDASETESEDSGGGEDLSEVPADFVRGVLGVGYGGLRVASRDGGKTWETPEQFYLDGGDGIDLFRKAAWSSVNGGTWLVIGGRLFRSHEGLVGTWEPVPYEDNPADGIGGRIGKSIRDCVGTEALAAKGDSFYIVCGYGDNGKTPLWRSDDGGDTWYEYGEGLPDDGSGHVFLDYRGNKFIGYSDSGEAWESDDALTFTKMQGVTFPTFCQGQWRSRSDCPGGDVYETFAGYVRGTWRDKIDYSETGTGGWTTRATTGNSIVNNRSFAEGWLAPAP